MDKLLLKKAALQSVALMICVMTLSYALKQYQSVTVTASDLTSEEALTMNASMDDMGILLAGNMDVMSTPVLIENKNENEVDMTSPVKSLDDLKNRLSKDILQKLGNRYLVIQKPRGDALTLDLHDMYINQSIQLELSGMEDKNISSNMIYRVNDNDLFLGEPQYTEISTTEKDDEGKDKEVVTRDYGTDISHGITFNTKNDGSSGLYSTHILLTLDSVYAYSVYEDNYFFYIDLKKPSDVYDRIVVIDAGHGGKDAGALSRGNKFYEKNINLGIALQLKKLLDKENIKVYYTRTGDDTVFLRPRVSLANAVDCDFFISIHCNANQVSYPNGTEVLYYDEQVKGISNHKLATLFSDEIAKSISLKQRGIVKKQNEDIFIMDKSKVPTILIEVGYLTNNNDMDYLSKSENRMSVAKGIYNGIMRAYDELQKTE